MPSESIEGDEWAAYVTLLRTAGTIVGSPSRLRLLRRERGLTQELLATRTGLSACAVRDIEAGRREFLLPVTAARLATVLGVDAAALANGTRP